LFGADGVVLVKKCNFLANTTPSARAKVASRFFLDCAATPSQLTDNDGSRSDESQMGTERGCDCVYGLRGRPLSHFAYRE
jgi:hypothetical protein